jgi:muconolactone delta-isomerase
MLKGAPIHMKMIAIEKELPGANKADFVPLLKREAARAWELYRAGIIRELYFRADRTEAVLVLECGTIDEANQALSSLPLVQNGLIAFEVIPLTPYPGFERLFVR